MNRGRGSPAQPKSGSRLLPNRCAVSPAAKNPTQDTVEENEIARAPPFKLGDFVKVWGQRNADEKFRKFNHFYEFLGIKSEVKVWRYEVDHDPLACICLAISEWDVRFAAARFGH